MCIGFQVGFGIVFGAILLVVLDHAMKYSENQYYKLKRRFEDYKAMRAKVRLLLERACEIECTETKFKVINALNEMPRTHEVVAKYEARVNQLLAEQAKGRKVC